MRTAVPYFSAAAPSSLWPVAGPLHRLGEDLIVHRQSVQNARASSFRSMQCQLRMAKRLDSRRFCWSGKQILYSLILQAVSCLGSLSTHNCSWSAELAYKGPQGAENEMRTLEKKQSENGCGEDCEKTLRMCRTVLERVTVCRCVTRKNSTI